MVEESFVPMDCLLKYGEWLNRKMRTIHWFFLTMKRKKKWKLKCERLSSKQHSHYPRCFSHNAGVLPCRNNAEVISFTSHITMATNLLITMNFMTNDATVQHMSAMFSKNFPMKSQHHCHGDALWPKLI